MHARPRLPTLAAMTLVAGMMMLGVATPAAAAPEQEIRMGLSGGFDPKVAVVSRDTLIRFTNIDAGIAHWPVDNFEGTAQVSAGCFDIPEAIGGGESIGGISIAHCNAVVSYKCFFHPSMQGTIIITS